MSDKIEEAKKWWDRSDGGHDICKRRADSAEFKEQQKNMDFRSPHHKNYIGGESAILLGKKWDKLNKKERAEVVNAHNQAFNDNK